MQVKVLSVLLALALSLIAGVACAETIAIDAPPDTRNDGIPELFCYPEGAREVEVLYSTTVDTIRLNIDPTGIPGYLHIVIPEEATLTRGQILFTVPSSSPDGSTAPTFAIGDTCDFYIGEALYDDWFKVTGWSEADLWLIGSGAGLVDVYWYVEKYTDSE